jgi:hypothetical protein
MTENRTAEGRAANRRVDIIILGKQLHPVVAKEKGDRTSAAVTDGDHAQTGTSPSDHPFELKPFAVRPTVLGAEGASPALTRR